MSRERLVPLIGRRVTHWLYNRKGHRNSEFPGFLETAAVYLADIMPKRYYERHGHEGIVRLAYAVRKAGKFTYGAARAGYRFAKWAAYPLRSVRRRRAHHPYVVKGRKNGTATIDLGGVLLQDYQVTGNSLLTFLERAEPVSGDLLFFLHLYPQDHSELEPEQQEQGFISFDHWPSMPISTWRKGVSYRNGVTFAGIPSGYYRLVFGIYDARSFQRLTVPHSGTGSVDLGWHYIEIPAPEEGEQNHDVG